MTEVQTGAPARPRRRVWPLALVTGVWLFLLAPIAIISLMSLMLADSGVTTKIEAVIYLFLAWPVVLLISLVCSWTAFAFRRTGTAWVTMAIPAIWPVIPFMLAIT